MNSLSKFIIVTLAALMMVACHKKSNSTDNTVLLYFNGDIITMSGDSPEYVEALVQQDGKIAFVGSLEEAKKQFPDASQKDLQGKTLLPGFIDGHGHITGVGFQGAIANLLAAPDGEGDSVEDIIRILKEWKDENPEYINKIGWVLGIGYDDALLDRYPTKEDLDKVSTDLPVYIVHQSGHLGVANTKALEMVGINAASKNPDGGVIRRMKDSQEPSGVLEENANFQVLYGQVMPKLNLEMELENLKKGQEIYASYGYTTAQDGRSSKGNTHAMEEAAQRGQLFIDVVSYPDIITNIENMDAGTHRKNYENHYRVGGIKITLDGSPQGKTAWLTRCYHVNPEGQDGCYKGYESYTNEQVDAYVKQAFENDWQLLAHVNGDAAIDQLLHAVHQANEALGKKERRTVAVHSQTVRFDQLDQMKEEGIMPSLFPMHTFYWGDWHVNSVLGKERAFKISPTKTALEKGLIFTSHHDAPVTFPNSLRVLDATVNRVSRSGQIIGPDERVSPYIGLKSLTDWAAYQHFEEDRKGTLEKGKVADLVILDQNPLKIDPMNIHKIKVLETIKEGKVIFHEK